MEPEHLTEADLSLAFGRVRNELTGQAKTGRTFVANPWELELVEKTTSSWIRSLTLRVAGRTWTPGPLEICDAPKGAGLVRPAAKLALEDRIVYTAAVGKCLASIFESVRWSQGGSDFAPRLNPAAIHASDWLRNPYKGWKEWHDRSLQRLDSPSFNHVVTADIAGFFENVSIQLLCSDLRRIGAPAFACTVISSCLNAWSASGDRGLPQGVLASDILAKLYLEPVDQKLRRAGFVHLRYVDDFRVFTETQSRSQVALVTLIRALRVRGLVLQSAKTSIRKKEDVRAEIDGVIPVIQELRRAYINEARAAGLMEDDVSVPMAAVDEFIGDDDDIEPAVLRRAFREYVVRAGRPNKSLLNFILGRLGRIRDDFAVSHCEQLLVFEPQHTTNVLKYFAALRSPEALDSRVTSALRSQTGATYPYQRYLLLEWLNVNANSVSDDLIGVVRQLAFKPESPGYVQAVARCLLGRFGDSSDLDELEALFRSTGDPLARAQLLCCLDRLELGRRNSLAGRLRTEDGILGAAAKHVMSSERK